MSLKKPSPQEDEYFARQEAKLRELLAIRRQHLERIQRREAPRYCPVCSVELREEDFRDIVIDRCPECRGVWLDPGELEKIAHDDASIVRAFFDFFAGRR